MSQFRHLTPSLPNPLFQDQNGVWWAGGFWEERRHATANEIVMYEELRELHAALYVWELKWARRK